MICDWSVVDGVSGGGGGGGGDKKCTCDDIISGSDSVDDINGVGDGL